MGMYMRIMVYVTKSNLSSPSPSFVMISSKIIRK